MIILRQQFFSRKEDEPEEKKKDRKSLSDYDSNRGILEGAMIAGGDDAFRGLLKGTVGGGILGSGSGAIYRTVKDREKYRKSHPFESFRKHRGHTGDRYILKTTPSERNDHYKKDSEDYGKLVRRRNRFHKNLKSEEGKKGGLWGALGGGPAGMIGASIGSGFIPSYVAVKSGEIAADKADSEGKSDKEILKKAAWSGLTTGALAGGIKGIVSGASRATPKLSLRPKTQSTRTLVKALKSGYSSAIIGGLGGMTGATTNTNSRLKKRKKDEKKQKEKEKEDDNKNKNS